MNPYSYKYESFSSFFSKQLQEILQKNHKKSIIKVTLKLPFNYRFCYIDFNHIYSEISSSLSNIYDTDFEIINIVPNPNDDHFFLISYRILN